MTRNPTWSRDELILALDLYLRHRDRLPDKDSLEIIELSSTLNSLFGARASDASLFRNPNGVYMKLANFRSVDPEYTAQGKLGLTRGGHSAEKVWYEFADRPATLHATAKAIRSLAGSLEDAVAAEQDGFAEAPEGRLLTRQHVTRERNRELVRKKRESVLSETGRLACDACGFDFEASHCTHSIPDQKPVSRI